MYRYISIYRGSIFTINPRLTRGCSSRISEGAGGGPVCAPNKVLQFINLAMPVDIGVGREIVLREYRRVQGMVRCVPQIAFLRCI